MKIGRTSDEKALVSASAFFDGIRFFCAACRILTFFIDNRMRIDYNVEKGKLQKY